MMEKIKFKILIPNLKIFVKILFLFFLYLLSCESLSSTSFVFLPVSFLFLIFKLILLFEFVLKFEKKSKSFVLFITIFSALFQWILERIALPYS